MMEVLGLNDWRRIWGAEIKQWYNKLCVEDDQGEIHSDGEEIEEK